MYARFVCLVGVLIVFASSLAAQDQKKELAKLQGTWILESRERKGEKKDDAEKLTITGNQWSWVSLKPAPVVPELTKAKIKQPTTIGGTSTISKIDPTKEPKELDLAGKGVFGTPTLDKCIYKWEDDRLVVCRPMGKMQERPTEFDSSADKTKEKWAEVSVWKRAKK